jgi:alkanesulfonate monooxygenase SsuD/methylene tetrahydromethanopterin reductase-like flavin-dependent oxidoreductase (luciferase family)
VEHHGRFFDFAPLQMSPPPEAPPPIWVGGLSRAALRRAATRGDGWIGTGQTPEDAVRIVAELRRLRAGSPRAALAFEAIVPLVVPPDRELLRRLSDAGVTATTAWPFPYTIGARSTLAQKRDAMLRSTELLRKGTDLSV